MRDMKYVEVEDGGKTQGPDGVLWEYLRAIIEVSWFWFVRAMCDVQSSDVQRSHHSDNGWHNGDRIPNLVDILAFNRMRLG
jgi:hypothetical protein